MKSGEIMDDCIFCKIVKGEIPSTKIYEDNYMFCFKDIKPEAPVHIVIVPKEHIESINAITIDNSKIISHIYLKVSNIAKGLGIKDSGYRLVCNCGEDGGQNVNHLHFHLLGGRKLTWPPG